MSKVKEKLRVLIVDDEERARARVRRLLSAHLHIEVVGEASGLLEAVAAYNSLRPDLIFLDIEMPDGRGFELFDRCEVGCPVIFVTAYDQHAVRAFEVNALDYLLKPIEANRLRQSLERFATLAQPAPTGSGCRGGDPPPASTRRASDRRLSCLRRGTRRPGERRDGRRSATTRRDRSGERAARDATDRR